jgi:ATP-dependent protease HslVU (ClpYQ) peptidase subunit
MQAQRPNSVYDDLTVRHKGRVAIGGDRQVSLGDTVMRSTL